MKFSALPVHSFEDVTLDLEQLQTLLTAPSGQSLPFLQLLSSRQLQLAFGSSSQTMPAATAGTFAITHGLPRAAAVAFAIPDGGVANDLTVGVTALGATTFTVTWRRASGLNAPTPLTWWWIALG